MLKSKINSGIGLEKRSKSLCSLDDKSCSVARKEIRPQYRANQRRTVSESSLEITAVSETKLEARNSRGDDKTLYEQLCSFERAVDRLTDMVMEQRLLLAAIKEEIREDEAMVEQTLSELNEITSGLLMKALGEMNNNVAAPEISEDSRAKCLLDAIESNQGSVDSEIYDVLVSFLQSEELKEHVVQSTAESVRDVIASCLSRDMSALYLPILQRSHGRLMHHNDRVIKDAFKELKEHSGASRRSLSKSVLNVSKSLERAIERHRLLLEAAAEPQENLTYNTLKCTFEELLTSELTQWRQKVLETFTVCQEAEEPPESPSLDYAPACMPQPPDSQTVAVEITRQIERGEVNSAFERALSAADLTLVMAACRAAKDSVFTPRCQLQQHVLLSLLQQLSTNMLHNTQLNCVGNFICEYMEDAIIHLKAERGIERAPMALALGEVRCHLRAFLAAHPAHALARRVGLIVMAADNLLK